MSRVVLRATGPEDRDDLLRLWNDGRVMRHVGFPEGLDLDAAGFDEWLAAVTADPHRHHFVVHALGFCGEVFYAVEGERAGLDIKLVPEAQGRGLASEALRALIDEVFAAEPGVQVVWTEPRLDNAPARRLYARCGLRSVPGAPPGFERWELARFRRPGRRLPG